MKKTIVMLLGLILMSAISMAMITPAKAWINIVAWRPLYIYNDDASFGEVVYKDGTTATVLVYVQNNYWSPHPMNVSKVAVQFYQIGVNATLDLLASPRQLAYNEVGMFTVQFMADGTKFLSGMRFDYNIIVEHVNATAGPMKVVDYWSGDRWDFDAPAFEVYPVAQADAEDSLSKYETYYDNFPSWYWDSVLGEQKYTQAIIEKDLGDTYYDRGDYASALTHYNAANTLWEEALTAESNWRGTSRDAELNVTLTQAAAAMTEANAAMVTAEATKTQADAAITNAYGWYFIGIGFAIGWSLMGVGAIIWAWRRPKPPV